MFRLIKDKKHFDTKSLKELITKAITWGKEGGEFLVFYDRDGYGFLPLFDCYVEDGEPTIHFHLDNLKEVNWKRMIFQLGYLARQLS